MIGCPVNKGGKKQLEKFWQFKNTATVGAVELLLYGEIKSEKSWWEEWFGGSGVYANQFVQDLQEMGSVNQITCRINSPGGDIFAAVAIYTQLKTHSAKVIAIIDGIAASAATLILMAADEIQMPNGAMVMIHDPLAGLMGMYKADELTKHAETLITIKESVVSIYAERTKTSTADLLQMMSDETWMGADKAIETGFCDKKIEGKIDIEMKGKVAFVNGINHDVSGFKNLSPLEHANRIAGAIVASNSGDGLVANFVNLAAKKNDGAEDDDECDCGKDDCEKCNPKNAEPKGTKAKNTKAKDEDDIDDDDADGDPDDPDDPDAVDDKKSKKAKKADKAVKDLMNKYPNITNRIIRQAKASERQRIQSIDAIANQLNPELAHKAKYTTPQDAKDILYENALQSQGKRGEFLNQFQTQTTTSGVKDVVSTPVPQNNESIEGQRSAFGERVAAYANKKLGR
jgi:ATP-dependent protease ClpP protease subunit